MGPNVHLVATGRIAQAIDVGTAAAAADPLRESAARALVSAHLQDGNPSEAIRQYERYRATLADQLGLEPSSSFANLIGCLR